jgi:hypothetical protein
LLQILHMGIFCKELDGDIVFHKKINEIQFFSKIQILGKMNFSKNTFFLSQKSKFFMQINFFPNFFCQNEFFRKIQILFKNPNIGQKSIFLLKNSNYDQKFKFWKKLIFSKNSIPAHKSKFWTKINF